MDSILHGTLVPQPRYLYLNRQGLTILLINEAEGLAGDVLPAGLRASDLADSIIVMTLMTQPAVAPGLADVP